MNATSASPSSRNHATNSANPTTPHGGRGVLAQGRRRKKVCSSNSGPQVVGYCEDEWHHHRRRDVSERPAALCRKTQMPRAEGKFQPWPSSPKGRLKPPPHHCAQHEPGEPVQAQADRTADRNG